MCIDTYKCYNKIQKSLRKDLSFITFINTEISSEQLRFRINILIYADYLC